MVEEIRLSEPYKKIHIKNSKEINENYFKPKTLNNNTFEGLKYSRRNNKIVK